ncbi:hypothetical protein PVAP13_8KG341800 [Panicum virgatum]|uniref:Uncharacterized protein n=1 Tax=Panicum virgatum TaxID=38727 RepID=A0A8T0PNV9_PANVG|nr:hypothetical protein PVAP13_8KG341800 [Panicum virgatum]
MGRVAYLMSTSLLILLMISSNSPSCQACIGPWCKPPGPCFPPTDKDYCTKAICPSVCAINGHETSRAYCKRSRGGHFKWLCCCPAPRLL